MAESKEFNYGFVLKEQEILFASIQKVANRVLKYKNPPRQLLLGRLTNLQHFWERCRRNHADLLANQKVPDDSNEDGIDYQEGCYEPEDFIETEDLYEEAIDYILSNLPDYQPVSENERSRNLLPESKPRATSSPAVKLPRISIPSFSVFSVQSVPKKVYTHQNSVKLECPVCKGDHNLYACSLFKEKTIDDRFEFLKANSRCFYCLGRHNRNACQSRKLCNVCKKPHHSLLHRDKDNSHFNIRDSNPNQNVSELTQTLSEVAVSTHLNSSEKCRSAVLLATARVIVEAPDGRRVYVRALLDQGSEASFLSESVAQLLRLPRKHMNVSMTGLGENFSNKVLHAVPIRVKSIKHCTTTLQTQAFVLPKITAYTPTEFTMLEIPNNLLELELADPDPWGGDRIDLLIGSDLYGQTLKPQICSGQSGKLVAQSTIFGWILSGPLQRSPINSYHISVHHSMESRVDETLHKFWELEQLPTIELKSKEDVECESHFVETHSRNSSGKYTVNLPFSDSPMQLGDSYEIALTSLHRLEKKFVRDPELAKQYQGFMKDYEKLRHMSLVDSDKYDSSRVFILHHPIIRESSQTTKLRVVFNASSPTSNKVSINDCLHVGPKLQTDISSIILRWRQHEFVLCADVANMFRQILIAPSDRKFQCILWRETLELPVNMYELNTVTYGMSCSPYLAKRVLQQLAHDEKDNYPLAAQVLLNESYVDDIFLGGSDRLSTLELRDQVILLTKSGGFQLRKWFSNSSDLLDGLESAEHSLEVEIPFNESSGFKVLGIFWNPSDDAFYFKTFELPEKQITKRLILSAIAKLFDPMGWISPVTIIAKVLLQELWLRKLEWDDLLPLDLVKEWQQFRSTLPALSNLSIPRWTQCDPDTVSVEIHGFSDASSVAYSAAVYSRIQSSKGNISVCLLMSKTKVAPLKTISIPRLELCAASLLSKLVRYVVDSLGLAASQIYCWTDSSIVLSWLQKQPISWTTFVANRVSSILTELPAAQWNHVPSKQNPADCASRGLSAEDLVNFSLWWEGPTWLRNSIEAWPPRKIDLETTKELRIASHVVCKDPEPDWQSVLISRHSSWARLLRVTAYVLRAIQAFKNRTLFLKQLTAAEINNATLFWIRYVQEQSFHSEIQSLQEEKALPPASRLKKFTPFIDDKGIIRLGGRLRQSKLLSYQIPPAILPNHPISLLILKQLHCNLLHGGVQLTLYMCRTQYWVIGARNLIKGIIRECVVCVRDKARIDNQIMGELPTARVSPSRPFSHTGVDYAGPFLVRSSSGRGAKSHKAWIAVFVCFAVKAIHLELVHDYSTAAFLAAFRRFTSRRGLPTDLYSDNGTNFRGADRELSHTFRLIMKDPTLASHLASDDIAWHFMPPSAPHFGGLWEAGVKSVKFHLRKLLSNATPTSEEFSTLLCQIECCLNSRPIVKLNEDPESCEVLTPGHFLIGSALKTVPTASVLDLPENHLARWQFYQRILEQFWRSWSRDYLQSLQQRTKWFSEQSDLRVNDLVLLRNSNLPPAKWELGRVIKCIPGKDNHIRVVQVKTSKSEFTRPITQLVRLPNGKK